MKNFIEKYPYRSQRLFEIIIPLISWLLITMPLWLSFWHPATVAYFVLGFDVYWFYKSFTMALGGMRSFVTMAAHSKVDWLRELKKFPDWQKICHVVIIPEYKEPWSVLEDTLNNLTQQTYPLKNIIVVLATEAADPKADETGEYFRKKYSPQFKYFWVTKHPKLPGEIAGKSSNMAWAGRQAAEKLTQVNIPLDNVTVTSCDADALLPPKYCAYLTHAYLSDPESRYHFFQPAILFYANIWRVPLPSRVINTISSIFNLSMLSQSERLINFSTYSASLKTIADVGFWGVDIIPEDYHLFFKTYFAFGERVKTRPIFLPVLVDAAESTNFFKTMINQYEQHKRWAWGVSDIPTVLKRYFTDSKIPFWPKTMRVLNLIENHLLWPTNWFILTLGSTIPPIVNQNFARTVLGHNLAQLSSAILTFSIGFLAVMIIIDVRAKPARPKEYKVWRVPILFLQWLTLPVVSFFLSALPGLDAHTRLMLGKRLEYRVTEKV